jgi:hypothetical protein
MKLSVRSFAFTCAIILGVGIFLLTWWLIILYGTTGDTIVLSTFYPGYYVSPLGSLIGLGYGIVDGLIIGAVFAWLYNLLLPKKSAG